MTFPLMFLAAITCIAGFIPFGNLISSNGEAYTIHLDMQIAATSIIIAIASIALATYVAACLNVGIGDIVESRSYTLHNWCKDNKNIDTRLEL